ncbi:hypothetical protein INR49_018202 [Caranx melampygus]|nr:hypothetical protein INR49_018202 [Caranx melampygus]
MRGLIQTAVPSVAGRTICDPVIKSGRQRPTRLSLSRPPTPPHPMMRSCCPHCCPAFAKTNNNKKKKKKKSRDSLTISF